MSGDDTAALVARLDALERRVARLEDEVAIRDVLAVYGPSADSGASEAVGALWAEQGRYDAQVGEWIGPEAIGGMIEGEFHQSLMHNGCAHILTPPVVVFDGPDAAVATCYGLLCRRDAERGDRFYVWRVTATRWEMARTPVGWRVADRVNKVLDGDPEARALLRRAVEQHVAQRATAPETV